MDNTSDADKPVSTATQAALDAKVDSVIGKGLSTEDYSSAEKSKLAGIEAGAEVNEVNEAPIDGAQYARKDGGWEVVTGGGGGGGSATFDAVVPTDYATVGAAVTAGATSIFVKDGVYAESTITVTTDNVRIQGESRDGAILRFPTGQDGIHAYANGIVIENITLDARTNSAEAAYVVGDGSTLGTPLTNKGCFNVLRGCRVLGSPTIFAVYVAGASYTAGAQTMSYFDAEDLQTGNVIENCVLESTWNGDSFSFSLQKDGAFRNNYCEGRVAFYMQINSDCSGNTIVNSANHGIFVAGPTYGCTVNNNLIDSPATNGIRTQLQLEHPVSYPAYATRNCTFNGNTIRNAGDSAFAITETDSCVFDGNSISNPADHGIYLQSAKRNTVSGNQITNPRSGNTARGSGIYLVLNVTDNVISGNSVETNATATYQMHTGIANREGGDCQRNVVNGNVIRGRNTERTVWVQSEGWVISSNSIEGGNYAGIRLDGASDCVVTGNVLRNNTNDSNNSYGEVWLQGSSSRNVIEGNSFISDAANKAANGIIVDGAGCVGNKVGYNVQNGVIGALLSESGTDTEYLSETNTGDETSSTILSKLGIPSISGTNTGDQTISLTGDVTGSGTGTFAATLASTGVGAGTYTNANVTVDAK